MVRKIFLSSILLLLTFSCNVTTLAERKQSASTPTPLSTISETALPSATPKVASMPSSNDDPIVGTLVFLWYKQGREHANGQLRSLLGLYDSTNPEAQEQHIAWWKEAGLNLVLLSWWGIRPTSFYGQIHDAAQGYITRLEQHGMAWAIFWEDLAPAYEQETLAQLEEWTRYPHYYWREGKPVLFVYHRLYGGRPLTETTFWEKLGKSYYLVLDKVPDGAIAALPQGTGYTYWDVPFTAEGDLKRKYEAAQSNTKISRFFFVNHGFDNRGIQGNKGVLWPKGVPGYPDGSSPVWLQHQYCLAMLYSPNGIIFPFNELGEHTAFEPTDPNYGGFGYTYFEQMGTLVDDFATGTPSLCTP